MPAWMCVQDFLKFRQNRNLQARTGLVLAHMNETVTDMLWPHANDVTAPPTGTQQMFLPAAPLCR